MSTFRHPFLRYPCDPLELARHAADNTDMARFDMLVADTLDASNAYRRAAYEPAAVVGAPLERYRSEYPNPKHRPPDADDIWVMHEAAKEVECHGLPLAPGQVVLHGGSWPVIESSGSFEPEFVVEGMLSTTFMASVAQWHA
ncbi:hypothetical protein [Burkholderia aenigmatica]|uniref:hypothetical protein n=1 Tax=Burkholderia aenigmatica TaxID=2015348 RepID=UPI001583BBCC|nr:hypothetical protein [Burkholderia aenigmatica]